MLEAARKLGGYSGSPAPRAASAGFLRAICAMLRRRDTLCEECTGRRRACLSHPDTCFCGRRSYALPSGFSLMRRCAATFMDMSLCRGPLQTHPRLPGKP